MGVPVEADRLCVVGADIFLQGCLVEDPIVASLDNGVLYPAGKEKHDPSESESRLNAAVVKFKTTNVNFTIFFLHLYLPIIANKLSKNQ
jgi:hypothetical protein